MAEKTKLTKAFKEIESKLDTKNEKEKLLENFLNTSGSNLGSGIANEASQLQNLKDKVKNLQIK